MHSLLYRREALLASGLTLPEHTYYVDNLYAYIPYPKMQNIFYHDINFYHYLTGRFDQSVSPNVMFAKYPQQQLVGKLMYEAYSYDEIKALPKGLSRYMFHDFMVINVLTYFFTVGGTSNRKERKASWKKFLKDFKAKDKKMYRKFRYRSPAFIINVLHPWPFASWVAKKFYYYFKRTMKVG